MSAPTNRVATALGVVFVGLLGVAVLAFVGALLVALWRAVLS